MVLASRRRTIVLVMQGLSECRVDVDKDYARFGLPLAEVINLMLRFSDVVGCYRCSFPEGV
jgi:hypothetical protein